MDFKKTVCSVETIYHIKSNDGNDGDICRTTHLFYFIFPLLLCVHDPCVTCACDMRMRKYYWPDLYSCFGHFG